MVELALYTLNSKRWRRQMKNIQTSPREDRISSQIIKWKGSCYDLLLPVRIWHKKYIEIERRNLLKLKYFLHLSSHIQKYLKLPYALLGHSSMQKLKSLTLNFMWKRNCYFFLHQYLEGNQTNQIPSPTIKSRTTACHNERMFPARGLVPWEYNGTQTHTRLEVELLYRIHRSRGS